MERYRLEARKQAVQRGLLFISRTACRPKNFEDYGSTLLYFLSFVGSTARDATLRQTARKLGEGCFRQWRSTRTQLPDELDAETVADFVHGYGAGQRLGFRSERIKARLSVAAATLPAEDFLIFNPLLEPPPNDIPNACVCGTQNERGRTACRNRACRKRLKMMSQYKVWYTALTAAFCGEQYGVKLGARYADVLKWLPVMRPYRGRDNGRNPDFYDTVYAITHVIYTLNDYGRYQLLPRWLPDEFAFLKENLIEAITIQDPDMVGEFLDALLAFGVTDADPVMRAGIDYLLAEQHADGSWGELEVEDVIYRFHPTWTAIDGLRDYNWHGVGLKLPALKSKLLDWARGSRNGLAAGCTDSQRVLIGNRKIATTP